MGDERGAVLNRYELIQPSDSYEFRAPDDDVAEAVATLLSTMAGWRVIENNERGDRQGGLAALAVPEDEAEAYAERIKATIDERAEDLIAALRSVEIEPERRKRLGVDPEVWHEEMRTSLSDYRAKALGLADTLEASHG